MDRRAFLGQLPPAWRIIFTTDLPRALRLQVNQVPSQAESTAAASLAWPNPDVTDTWHLAALSSLLNAASFAQLSESPASLLALAASFPLLPIEVVRTAVRTTGGNADAARHLLATVEPAKSDYGNTVLSPRRVSAEPLSTSD